jgi:hypothetical protein
MFNLAIQLREVQVYVPFARSTRHDLTTKQVAVILMGGLIRAPTTSRANHFTSGPKGTLHSGHCPKLFEVI